MDGIKEIDLKSLAKDIVKRAWIIALCAVIFAVSVLVYNKNFVEKTYKAEITMYVVNKTATEGTGMSSQNLAVALQLTKSYVKLIQTDRVLDKVVEKAEMTSVTSADIRKMMTVEVVDDTEVFKVSIVSRNPRMSADIANAIASIAPDEIWQITGGSSVEVVDYAKVPQNHYAPNYTRVTVLGGLAGAVFATAVIAIFLLSDTRIKGKEDLEEICQIPVLGAIPDFNEIAKAAERNGNQKERRR